MFWGLNLKANRKYSQTTSKSFHISQAALDTESGAGPARLFLTYDNEKFLVCTLKKGECEQVMLDYNFAEGDEISFESKGNGNVALTGYVITDAMEDYMNGDEEESELEEAEVEDLRAALMKKKAKKNGTAVENDAAAAEEEEEDDEEEDDEDFDEENAQLAAEDEDDDEEEDDDDEEEEDEEDDEEEDDEDDDEEDDDEEEEEADEPVQQPKQKKAKLDKEAIKQNGVAKGAEKDNKKKNKKEQQQQQSESNKQGKQQPAGGLRTIAGGVKIEDLRVGNGPEVKQGKRAQVYYEGRLKSNNKVFDSSKQGAGFKFAVGRGEVIKAWDVGVVGMKVGGKRRVICPPHMAYGARGAPPSIPPNSTLVFEIELKGVN